MYLLGEEKLAKPLSQEELIKYFKMYKEGDMKAREIIILHNLRLVMYYINKHNFFTDKKELFSCGVEGLIKATDDYDISRGINFSTVAYHYIKNEIYGFLRINNKFNSDIALDNVSHLCSINNPIEAIEEKEIDLQTIEILGEIGGVNRSVLELYYGFGSTGSTHKLREISEIFGCSTQRVSERKNTSLSLIRKRLSSEGIYEFNENIK